MAEKRQWKLEGNSYQIGDTGDYDGDYRLTDGFISLITKDEICGEDAARLTALLNEIGVNWEDWNLDSVKFELHLEKEKCKNWESIANVLYEHLKYGFISDALNKDLVKYEELKDSTPAVVTNSNDFGKQISTIINQDGGEKTDGQCLDEIIEFLKSKGLYYKNEDHADNG